MNEEILKFCLEKGMLLDKETLNLLNDFDSKTAKEVIEKISVLKESVITKSVIIKNADRLRELIGDEKVVDKLKINLGISLEISRERYIDKKTEEEKSEEETPTSTGKNFELGNLKVISSIGDLGKKLTPADFIKHFRNRYLELKQVLQERQELENLSSINKISGQKQNISIIGAVFNKRSTKNKNILLEMEDLTGKIAVLINKDKGEIYEKAREIMVDDIIGVRGFGNREIIFVNEMVYPEVHLHERVSIERDERAAFISDIHIGSTNFLEKNFLKFIDWINGEVGDERQKQEAKKVKFLFITGDSVDGVGIFPGQEELLNIKDIKEQYNKLTEYLSKIRKDIKIVICPGQHDAVRVAEPQPIIGKNYAKKLYSLDNVILVSNPAVVEIVNKDKKGLKILMYHGASMHSFVNEIESLRIGKAHHHPAKVVKEMLKRRHLAPTHSAVTYIPTEKQDYMLIKEIPDIINTADFHRPDIDIHNNILIICSSCWQSITPFEEKVGNNPDPCKVPILNLKTREIKIMDFSEAKK